MHGAGLLGEVGCWNGPECDAQRAEQELHHHHRAPSIWIRFVKPPHSRSRSGRRIPTAIVKLALGAREFKQLASVDGGKTFTPPPLSPGDYVLVDSTVRPPIHVETSANVAFWSADTSKSPPVWTQAVGRLAVKADPRIPNPHLQQAVDLAPDPVLDGFLQSVSPIAETMQKLLDASLKEDRSRARTPAVLTRAYALPDRDRPLSRRRRAGRCHLSQLTRLRARCARGRERAARAGCRHIKVTLMIAPRPEGPGSDRAVLADCVPTYSNIVKQWRAVTDTARAGDIVYIHYSGHGGRAKTVFPDHKPTGRDESLAPCDINDRDRGRYLRDVEIAALLQRMAQKQLVTTLVLDSCHSGGATRGDQAQASAGDCDDLGARGSDAMPSDVAPPDELDRVARQLATRALGPVGTWRVDDQGNRTAFNTVIAACGENEASYEFSPEPEMRTGALTYFWLKALRARTPGATYRRLFDRVYGQNRDQFQSQTPAILGEENRSRARDQHQRAGAVDPGARRQRRSDQAGRRCAAPGQGHAPGDRTAGPDPGLRGAGGDAGGRGHPGDRCAPGDRPCAYPTRVSQI